MPENDAHNVDIKGGQGISVGRGAVAKVEGDSTQAELLKIANQNSRALSRLEAGQTEINTNMQKMIDAILDRLKRVEDRQGDQWFAIVAAIILALGGIGGTVLLAIRMFGG